MNQIRVNNFQPVNNRNWEVAVEISSELRSGCGDIAGMTVFGVEQWLKKEWCWNDEERRTFRNCVRWEKSTCVKLMKRESCDSLNLSFNHNHLTNPMVTVSPSHLKNALIWNALYTHTQKVVFDQLRNFLFIINNNILHIKKQYSYLLYHLYGQIAN